MGELVLNHASLLSPDEDTAIAWLAEVTEGIASLISNHVTTPVLHSHKEHWEIPCSRNSTLADIVERLRERGYRDSYALLRRLTSRAPLTNELTEDIKDRFLRCGSTTISSPDGDPLTLAAVANWTTISFPSQPDWDSDQLVVEFEETLPDFSLAEVVELTDNLSRDTHCENIVARRQRQTRNALESGIDLWNARSSCFPTLLFGPDVEGHLQAFDRRFLGAIVNKLAALDTAAFLWWQAGGAAPLFGVKVTDESESVYNNPQLRGARQFRSSRGGTELFMLHARFGNNGRIHLRSIAQSWQIEIGYVGPHLPL